MGKLTYDSTVVVDFDDRLLAHLQMVIATKLRRGESFAFSWRDDAAVGDGRTTIWLHPALPLVFKYFGGKPPAINRAWVEALLQTANSSAGLHIVPEPVDHGNEA
ncbi:MAG TPA: ATP-dependent DNA ligase [Amnibacterium sp.]|jgi:hypothetical protein|nr:ATP-dependent DNA ligase [Amnibacterium sp.]